jgi:hypothetical protein
VGSLAAQQGGKSYEEIEGGGAHYIGADKAGLDGRNHRNLLGENRGVGCVSGEKSGWRWEMMGRAHCQREREKERYRFGVRGKWAVGCIGVGPERFPPRPFYIFCVLSFSLFCFSISFITF